ncbi:hypothetical protein BJV74DRAFT_77606 [Russula compacta]|nr:hypothetical protein BJV74DRAFT_77606 [Russula compacta]
MTLSLLALDTRANLRTPPSSAGRPYRYLGFHGTVQHSLEEGEASIRTGKNVNGNQSKKNPSSSHLGFLRPFLSASQRCEFRRRGRHIIQYKAFHLKWNNRAAEMPPRFWKSLFFAKVKLNCDHRRAISRRGSKQGHLVYFRSTAHTDVFGSTN